ncbi:MAG: hypothetical protein HQK53_08040 [Oligoflexia bacterium]|nr:hypothetical protein [Oligoflexia bacterium]
MNKDVKSIIYLGMDDSTADKIKFFYYIKDEIDNPDNRFIFKKISPDEEHYLSTFWDSWRKNIFPQILFIDFQILDNDKMSIEDLTNLCLIIKKHSIFKSTLIVGILENKNRVKNLRSSLLNGINYIYLKTTFEKTSLSDVQRIAFANKTNPNPNLNPNLNNFALAFGLSIPAQINFPASISYFNAESVLIEHNLEINKEINPELSLRTRLLNFLNDTKDYDLRTYKIENLYPGGCSFDFHNNTLLSFIYPDVWDDIDDNSISKDTIETWIHLNCDQLKAIPPSLLIIDTDEENLYEIFQIKRHPSFQIEYRNIIIEQELKNILELLTPKIIFINFNNNLKTISTVQEDEQSEHNKQSAHNEQDGQARQNDVINLVINTIRESQATEMATSANSILLIIYNNSATSAALQKTYNYENILTYSQNIKVDIIHELLNIYLKRNILKKQHTSDLDISSDNKTFSIADDRKIAEIEIEITITSLSEHQITFLSEMNIPIYSLFLMHVPRELYCTIIPPTHALNYYKGKHHYMAIIHGVNEEDLRCLRVLVNNLLSNPIKKLIFLKNNCGPEELKLMTSDLDESMMANKKSGTDSPTDQSEEVSDLQSFRKKK